MIFYFLAGLVLLGVVVAGIRWFARADAAAIAARLRMLGPVVLGLVVLLAVSRLGPAGLFLATFALPMLMQRRNRTSWRAGAAASGAAPVSTIETLFLHAELDHDSGEMTGDVLRGVFEGRRMESLTPEECGSLARELSGRDEDGLAVLREFHERRFGTPLEFESDANDGTAGSGAAAQEGVMTADAAARLLGVDANASAEEIRAAWRRRMKDAHPDAGGSAAAAARLNEARDLLLRRRDNHA